MAPARIVIADDSKAFCTALCAFLASIPDIEIVAVASGGAEAIKLVEEFHPDLLILDLQMPRVDGWQVLSRLRAMRSRVRVLVLSAHPEAHYRETALDRGAVAYVAKGDVQRLINTLRQLIRA